MQDAPTPIAELEQGPSKFDIFMEKHQKKLIIASILIFLGVIGYVFYSGLEKMKNEEAGAALLVATTENDYKAIISKYSDRPAAGTAALLIAELRTNNDDAIKALQHYLATYPDHPAVTKAEFELATRQLNAKHTKDATTTLEGLIAREDAEYLIPAAKIALGDIAAQNNEIEKAERLYLEALEGLDVSTIFARTAHFRLKLLKAKKPNIIEPKVPKLMPDNKPATPSPSLAPSPTPPQQ